MSNKFLERAAEQLLEEFGPRMQDLHMLFPNRRAILFFNKIVSQLIDRPLWVPPQQTIREYFRSCSSLTPADDLRLINDLYLEYRKLTEGPAETLDDFYHRGEMILADFDDADTYLANPAQLFIHLQDLQDLEQKFPADQEHLLQVVREFWFHMDTERMTWHKKEFLRYWNLLYPLYHAFRKRLQSGGTGYEGMIAREALQRIREDEDLFMGEKTFVLIGFNALTECEKQFFLLLKKAGRARFFWDYDHSYTVREPLHQAGRFIRENLKLFGQDLAGEELHDNLAGRWKKWYLTDTSTDVAQARLVPELLSGEGTVPQKENPQNTAIVLADENLLEPVLHSLPSFLKDINITMGYALSNSPVYTLISYWMRMHQTGRSHGRTLRFHRREVLSLVNHRLMKEFFPGPAGELAERVHHRELFFVEADSVQGELETFFAPAANAEDFCARVRLFLTGLAGRIRTEEKGQEDNPMLWDALIRLYDAFTVMRDLWNEWEHKPGIKLFFSLADKYLRSLKIPFTGEPLKGIQIMGLLETRGLDFDHVLLLSCNEGILPGSTSKPSLIPYSVRKSFGLPTPDHQDSIYAYYFYRLVQRASRVDILYNSSTEGLRTGEVSRFIRQLQYNHGIDLKNRTVGMPAAIEWPSGIELRKEGAVLESLRALAEGKNGDFLSPSALNKYINCPLQFCLKYISRLPENREWEDRIDAMTFGNVFHHSLQQLYQPLSGKECTATEMEKLLAKGRIRPVVEESLRQHLAQGQADALSGLKKILEQIITSLVERTVEIDRQTAPFRLLGLEEKRYFRMEVGTQQAKLGGKIDRLDQVGNTLRVIDYKTGSVPERIVKIPDLFNRDNTSRNSAAFQVFLYCMMLEDHFPGLTISPYLMGIRQFYARDRDFSVQARVRGSKTESASWEHHKEEFMEALELLLRELLDPEIPFRQTENLQTCRLCPYKTLCAR